MDISLEAVSAGAAKLRGPRRNISIIFTSHIVPEYEHYKQCPGSTMSRLGLFPGQASVHNSDSSRPHIP